MTVNRIASSPPTHSLLYSGSGRRLVIFPHTNLFDTYLCTELGGLGGFQYRGRTNQQFSQQPINCAAFFHSLKFERLFFFCLFVDGNSERLLKLQQSVAVTEQFPHSDTDVAPVKTIARESRKKCLLNCPSSAEPPPSSCFYFKRPPLEVQLQSPTLPGITF